MFGFGYVMQFAVDITKQNDMQEAYRIYMTDCAMIATQNLSRFCHGKEISSRYADIVGLNQVEDKDPEEIIDDITEKLKKLGGEEDG